MKKKIVMLMLAAALAATAVAGCSKNNTSQEQDIASDAQEATMPDGAIDEAFGQPSEDETGDAAVQNSNEYKQKPLDIYVVYPNRRHLPAKVRAFIEFLASLGLCENSQI